MLGVETEDVQPLQALYNESETAIRQLQHLVNTGNRSDRIEIGLCRFLNRCFTLRENTHQRVRSDRLFDKTH